MAHGYYTLQHWNQWLSHTALGKGLREAEKQALTRSLRHYSGEHGLLLGVPSQHKLMNSMSFSFQSLITPLTHFEKKEDHFEVIEAHFKELPILTGSVDWVILPHTLEFVDNPHQVLQEACRVIKPEGLIVIFGFNPYSTWGIKKLLIKRKKAPWLGHFIPLHKIKMWLRLTDFALEKQDALLFWPSFLGQDTFSSRLRLLEHIEGKYFSKYFSFLGGVYVMVARAKVIPLTPIRLKWKQRLSGIQISPTI